jgi:hypothetical protein
MRGRPSKGATLMGASASNFESRISPDWPSPWAGRVQRGAPVGDGKRAVYQGAITEYDDMLSRDVERGYDRRAISLADRRTSVHLVLS